MALRAKALALRVEALALRVEALAVEALALALGVEALTTSLLNPLVPEFLISLKIESHIKNHAL